MQKRRWIISAALAVLLLSLLCIQEVQSGVRAGLEVCAKAILPSLFLFSVLANITAEALAGGKTVLPPKYTIFFLGAVCGFPLGALFCERFSESGLLTERDAAKLLPLCNQASPAFILGTIGAALLNDPKIGILLYISQLLAAFLLLLPIRTEVLPTEAPASELCFSKILTRAVENAIGGSLRVCAWICLFSAILSVLRPLVGQIPYCLLAVFAEIGNGSVACAALRQQFPELTVALLAFGCGFSGLCVHLQVLSSLKSVKVKYSCFLLAKFLHGCLSAMLSLLFCKFAV